MSCKLPPIVSIVGPTASGKSALADALALKLKGEVLSADSMQIYRGMDIGTAKIPSAERSVAYWGLDIADPGQPYSAALFQDYGRAAIEDMRTRLKPSIICGGTGLYVRAVLDDYQFPQGEQEDNPVREKFEAFLEEHGVDALWNLLDKEDPQSAALIHKNNTRRVIRAFELLDEGTSYAEQHAGLSCIPEYYHALWFGLWVDPEVLCERIDARVDTMFEMGLVSEVESLLHRGLHESITAGQAIGYKEVVRALEGEISMSEARERIKISTRRYAKRQRTWFKADARICWLDANTFHLETLLESLELKAATIV